MTRLLLKALQILDFFCHYVNGAVANPKRFFPGCAVKSFRFKSHFVKHVFHLRQSKNIIHAFYNFCLAFVADDRVFRLNSAWLKEKLVTH